MTLQQGTKQGLTDGGWPAEGLETVASCPVCGGLARSALYTDLVDQVFFCAPGKWTLYRCKICRSAYLDPRPTPETISMAYSSYYTHANTTGAGNIEQTVSTRMRLSFGYLNLRYGYRIEPALKVGFLFAWVLPLRRAKQDRSVRHLRRRPEGACLLDVGCGNGDFLAWMRRLGWTVAGVEPDSVAVASARAVGLSVRHGTLGEAAFPANHFDAITMNHVIEHLHDPISTLRECYRILRPGGVLWVATPNLASEGHRLFRRHWLNLDPPRHLVLFTLGSLRTSMEDAGFEVSPRPKVSYSTHETFRASAAIKCGADPVNSPPPLPRQLRLKTRLAELKAWLRPQTAEELILIAHKPAS